MKQADNRNAQSTARQALVGEASEIGAAELNRRLDQRKSPGAEVQLTSVSISEEPDSADDAAGVRYPDSPNDAQRASDTWGASEAENANDAESASDTWGASEAESASDAAGASDTLGASEAETANDAGGVSDEDELITRSLAGNDDSFETLVRRHSSRVFSIVGSFFRRRDMVEDIAQEVFAKAFFSLGTFTLGRSFEAWVAKIAVNACYDHLRAQRRRIEQQLPHETQQEDEWFELQMLEVARDRHASAERQRDAAEIADRLLSKLEPEDRLVVVLIDRDGFSVKEVSEMTGWGQSKVKVRAFRARRVLRAAMKRLVLSGERMQRSKKK